MASAFPSGGVGCPAARLAVRNPGMVALGPGGEIRGGVAVPVDGQSAGSAAEHPLRQPHRLLDQPTSRAGPGGWEPTVTDDQLRPEPGRLVADLAGKLGPAGIKDRAGQVFVAKEVGDGEVLQAEPVGGLDELAGDIMKKATPDVGDTGMLARQPPSCLGPIA